MENIVVNFVYLTQLWKRRQPVLPQQSQVIIFLSTTHHKVGQELLESYCFAGSICHPTPPVVSSLAGSSQQIETVKCQTRIKDEHHPES